MKRFCRKVEKIEKPFERMREKTEEQQLVEDL